MRKNTAKFKILQYLVGRESVNRGELEEVNYKRNWGYNGSTIARACRHLRDDGLINKIPTESGQAVYRLNKKRIPARLKQKLGMEMSSNDIARLVQ